MAATVVTAPFVSMATILERLGGISPDRVVMEPLHFPQSVRLQHGAPLAIDAAIQTADELLWGAEAVSTQGGAPTDFSLEHCYQATQDPSPAVITHAMIQLRDQ